MVTYNYMRVTSKYFFRLLSECKTYSHVPVFVELSYQRPTRLNFEIQSKLTHISSDSAWRTQDGIPQYGKALGYDTINGSSWRLPEKLREEARSLAQVRR